MSIVSRVPAAQALLERSRNVLDAVARRAIVLDSAGITPPKPTTARDGAAQDTFVQRHGGR